MNSNLPRVIVSLFGNISGQAIASERIDFYKKIWLFRFLRNSDVISGQSSFKGWDKETMTIHAYTQIVRGWGSCSIVPKGLTCSALIRVPSIYHLEDLSLRDWCYENRAQDRPTFGSGRCYRGATEKPADQRAAWEGYVQEAAVWACHGSNEHTGQYFCQIDACCMILFGRMDEERSVQIQRSCRPPESQGVGCGIPPAPFTGWEGHHDRLPLEERYSWIW